MTVIESITTRRREITRESKEQSGGKEYERWGRKGTGGALAKCPQHLVPNKRHEAPV